MSNAIQWFPLGPAPQVWFDKSPVSGRVTAMDVSPDATGNGDRAAFIGIDGGGVWRSFDFTSDDPVWEPLTDTLPLPLSSAERSGLLRVSSIAVDPNHSRTVYAATGAGVLKSVDGGRQWTLIGREMVAHGLGVSKIIVDPLHRTGDVLYATGANFRGSLRIGIYKSADAGLHWAPDETGLPASADVLDLAYTTTLTSRRQFSLVRYAGLPGSGIWTSVAGAPWTKMTVRAVDHAAGDVAVTSDALLGTIEFAAAGSSDLGVYATVTNRQTAAGEIAFLLTVLALDSTDMTWKAVNSGLPSRMNLASGSAIALSPDGTLYFGVLSPFQSTDRGRTWHTLNTPMEPHVDYHSWMFDDADVYAGNDGGIYRYRPTDRAKPNAGAWTSLSTTSLQTHLLNSVGASPRDPGVLVAGAQDNATSLRQSGVWTTPLVSRQPIVTVGGDVQRVQFDPSPQGRTLYSIPLPTGGPTLHRSDDGGATWLDRSLDRNAATLVAGDGHTEFPAFAIDAANGARVAMGYRAIYESSNRGDIWGAASTLLDAANNGSTVNALAYGGSSLYAGYSSGAAFKRDTGNAWVRLTPAAGAFGGPITSIVTDGARTAFLSVGRADATGTDPSGKVWSTADAGATWRDITGNLTRLVVTALTQGFVDGKATRWVFAATNVGVFFSDESTACWMRLGRRLPDVETKDIRFDQAHQVLHAATFGRGVFFCQLAGLARPFVTIERKGSPRPGQVTYVATTSGLSDWIPVTYAWTVVGVSAVSAVDQPSITVAQHVLPMTGRISVAVSVDGCALSDSLTVRSQGGGPPQ